MSRYRGRRDSRLIVFQGRTAQGQNRVYWHRDLKALTRGIPSVSRPDDAFKPYRGPNLAQPSADIYREDRLAKADDFLEAKQAELKRLVDEKLGPGVSATQSVSEVQQLATEIAGDEDYRKALLARFYKDHPVLFFGMEIHKNTRDEPMDFRNRRWLLEFYGMDMRLPRYRKLVVKKSVQCGISEWAICSVFCFAELGLSTLYVLPNRDFRARFVANRVDGMIGRVPYYKALLEHSKDEGRDTTNFKQIGNATQFFAAAGSENEFKEFPCDVVFIDELDQCNSDNIAMAEDRYSASKWKIKIEVSNPSHEEYGICKKYERSTKGQWNVRCDHCNHWQVLDWYKHVLIDDPDGTYELMDRDYDPLDTMEDPKMPCQRCGKPLNRLGTGAWVHTHPKRESVGFHISKLFQGPPMTTVRELVLKYDRVRTDPGQLTKFVNSDLGLGHSQKGQKLDELVLESCAGKHFFGYNPDPGPGTGYRTAGIDVGTVLNIIVEDHPALLPDGSSRTLYAAALSSWDEVEAALTRFRVDFAVVDLRPEATKAKEFAEAEAGRATCEYTDNSKSLQYHEDKDYCQVDRTIAIDQVVSRFFSKQAVLPADWKGHMSGDFVKQLLSSVRVFDAKAKRGEGAYRWVHTEPDHFLHCYVYSDLARQIMVERGQGSSGILVLNNLPTNKPGSRAAKGKSKFGKAARKIASQNPARTMRQELQDFIRKMKNYPPK